MRKSLKERFWEKVDKRGPDDCWEWTACQESTDYGGMQNKDLCIVHRCGNPFCVNPAHLSIEPLTDDRKD